MASVRASTRNFEFNGRRTVVLSVLVAGLAGGLPEASAQDNTYVGSESQQYAPKAHTTRAFFGIDSLIVFSKWAAPLRVRPGASKADLAAKLSETSAGLGMAMVQRLLTRLPAAAEHGGFTISGTLARIPVNADAHSQMRDRLARNPVTVQVSLVGDGAGGAAFRRDYYAGGSLRISVFTPADVGPVTDAQLDEDARATPSDLSSHKASSVSITVNCEYTDLENNYWSGACATQGQLDTLAATVAAADAEAESHILAYEAASEDVQDDLALYCNEYPEDPVCLSIPEGIPALYASMNSALCDATPSDDETSVPSTKRDDCSEQAVNAFVGVAGFVFARWGAIALLGAANPPAGAVTATVGGVIVATVGLGMGVGSYLSCKYGELPPVFY